MNSNNSGLFFLNPHSNCIEEGVSLFTVVKNRTENLLYSLPTWLKNSEIDEIIILDWSSSVSVVSFLSEFKDERIKIFTAPNQPNWLPSHSRNLAARLTSRNRILKIDADAQLIGNFFEKHKLSEGSFYYSNWRRALNKNEQHLCGNFYCFREDFFKVNGFNEFITSYGWEDSDLYLRFENDLLLEPLCIDHSTIFHIPHDNMRHEYQDKIVNKIDEKTLSLIKIRINKRLTEIGYKWTTSNIMSSFKVDPLSNFCVELEPLGSNNNKVNPIDFKKARFEAHIQLISEYLGEDFNVIYEKVQNFPFEKLHKLLIYTLGRIKRNVQKIDHAFNLFINFSSEENFNRIFELLVCLDKNVNLNSIACITIFYDQIEGKKDYLKIILKNNNFQILPFKNHEPLRFLFDYADKNHFNENVIIANADIFYDHTLKKLCDIELKNRIITLTSYKAHPILESTPKLINGRPNYFSIDSYLFKGGVKLNFDFNNFADRMVSDPFFITKLFTKSKYRISNPCLEIKSFHLQSEFLKSDDYIKYSKAEQEKFYEYSLNSNGESFLSGVRWTNLIDSNSDLDFQVIWKNLNIYVDCRNLNDTSIIEKTIYWSLNYDANIWLFCPENTCEIVQIKERYPNYVDWIESDEFLNYSKKVVDVGEFELLYERDGHSHFRIDASFLKQVNLSSKTKLLEITHKPKISVITPTLNADKYLDLAIQSVLAQNYSSFEHIIIDGGSTDDTLNILKNYDHLIVFEDPNDEGQASAMNKGFEMATGEFIVYLNADDFFFENVFERVANAVLKGANFVVGKIHVQFTDGSHWFNNPGSNYINWLRHWGEQSFPVNPVGYFYRREIQSYIGGFNTNNHLTMDLEFLLEAGRNFPFYKLNFEFGSFRNYPNTKTVNSYYRHNRWSASSFPYISNMLDHFCEKDKSVILEECNRVYLQKNLQIEKILQLENGTVKSLREKDYWLIKERIKYSLELIAGKRIDEIKTSLYIVYCKVDDDYFKEVPTFLDHYFKLGFERVVFLHTGYDSKSIQNNIKPEYESRVSIYKFLGDKYVYGDYLDSYLLSKFTKGQWVVNATILEFLVMPFNFDFTINKLCDYLEYYNFDYVLSKVISLDFLDFNEFLKEQSKGRSATITMNELYLNNHIKDILNSDLITSRTEEFERLTDNELIRTKPFLQRIDSDTQFNYFAFNKKKRSDFDLLVNFKLLEKHRDLITCILENKYYGIAFSDKLINYVTLNKAPSNLFCYEVYKFLLIKSLIVNSVRFMRYVQKLTPNYLYINRKSYYFSLNINTIIEYQMDNQNSYTELDFNVNDNPVKSISLISESVKDVQIQEEVTQLKSELEEARGQLNLVYDSYSWKIGNRIINGVDFILGTLPFIKKRKER